MSIAKIKGSALPARDTAADTDYVFIVSEGVTYKMLRSVFLAQANGITTLGTITIVADEVTFEGFAWKIDGVEYAQVAPITRTLPFAAEGMYRTHTAYFTTTNDIDIAVGAEDDEITTEPDIPEGTLRMRAFNVFGEVITVGPGVPAPFDLLAFDEFTGDTDGWMWIKVLGYDFKIKRSTLMAGIGELPTLQQIIDNNHDLVDGLFFAGTFAGDGNTAFQSIGIGSYALQNNSGYYSVAIGYIAGQSNTGDVLTALGSGAGTSNTGIAVVAVGASAGIFNIFNNVNLFGENAAADENGQIVFGKGDNIMVRFSTLLMTATRKYNLPDADGTIALLSDIPTVNNHFLGKYSTLLALETAYPTASPGDYGQVDAGSGSDVVNYNWDDEEGWVAGSAGSGATDTDALPEGASNLYFTTARVLATALTGISFVTATAVNAADSVLVGIGKLQAQITSILTRLSGFIFTDLVDGFEVGTVDDKLTVKGDVTLEGGGALEHDMPLTSGRLINEDSLAAVIAAIPTSSPFVNSITEYANTGDINNNIVHSIDIPVGTVLAGDKFDLELAYYKVGVNAIATIRVYVNTSVSLSGAKGLGGFQLSAAGNLSARFRRRMAVKTLTAQRMFNPTNLSSGTDYGASSTLSTLDINFGVDQKLIFAIQNNSASDNVIIEDIYVNIIR